jgi:carboxymethylenebutenolidase
MPEMMIPAADGGSFGAYLATPKSGKGPGVLVIQEVFGVNPWVRAVVDGLALHGYIALAPDLFWRHEPGLQLDERNEIQRKRAYELYGRFDADHGVADLVSALDMLRDHPSCTGKAGSLGYCLGGRLAYLLAAHSDADCNVGYYGVGIQNRLDEAATIDRPLLLHIAESDAFVPRSAQAKIKAGLEGRPRVRIHSYPGADHAFARFGGTSYDQASAKLANTRTMEFLRRHLAA